MNTTSSGQQEALRRILSVANMDRLFRSAADFAFLLAQLEAFFGAYGRLRVQFGPGEVLPPTVNLERFVDEHRPNPERVTALLQAIAFKCSPDVLAAMWMVMAGANIQSLNYEYVQEERSALTIHLRSSGDNSVVVRSESHWDTALLRFAAVSLVDDAPIIESFYPLHIPKPVS